MPGTNPHPVRLVRQPVEPLSAMAQLGRLIFFDPTLSASGSVSCASCHSPQHAYGPPNGMSAADVRAIPSLMYLERQPPFHIGPDTSADEDGNAPSAGVANAVPQGGLFWDGRVDTLQRQAVEPLLDPREMNGGSIARIAAKLRRAPYAARFTQLFGPTVFERATFAVSEAMFAVGRYQIEDVSFHPYASRFDRWLEGRATLTPAQARGYAVFNDSKRGNCAACHLDRPTADGLPPLFTDHQYEALGVPRNPPLAANRDPRYHDLGICGPYRRDLRTHAEYCGLFLTPTLRNVATRPVFFHNGVYQTLAEAIDFYAFRDTMPQRVYPRRADGTIDAYNDLPSRYRKNIDHVDAPFGRARSVRPVLDAQDERDLIAFLRTLTDDAVACPALARASSACAAEPAAARSSH